MKSEQTLFSIFLLAISLWSFTLKNEIGPCYISFTSPSHLSATDPNRLPENSEKMRTLTTDKGEVDVSRIDGYRIMYLNDKNAPFVNLKVELSANNAYESDKIHIIDNLRYLNSHSQNMETTDLLELEFNGYQVYGFSRASIEMGNILGTFVMFPGNGVTVYFYFNNLKPEFRNFENVNDYKKQRDRFMNEYTRYLKTCKN